MIDLLINEIKKDKAKVLKFVSDNSRLKQGIYLKINVDKPFNSNSFFNFFIVDTSTLDTSRFVCNLPFNERTSLIDYVLERDIVSGILNDDANKTIDGSNKKILSSVYQTLCISNKFLTFPNGKLKSINDFIKHINDKGFDSLIDIGSKMDKTLRLKKLKIEPKDILEMIDFANSEFRINQIELIKNYIKNNFESIVDFVKKQNVSSTDKLKIFFYSETGKIEDSIDAYNREYKYYLSNYIFNKDTTLVIDGQIKGSISYGYNNSTVKPLIKPRRTNYSHVKYHSLDEALDTKIAYDLLKLISENRGAKLIGIDNIGSDEMFNCQLDDFVKVHNSNKSLYFKLNFKDKFIEDYDLISESQSRKDRIESKKINCLNYVNKSKVFLKKGNFEDESRSIFTTKELLSYMIHSKTENFVKYSEYVPYGLSSSNSGSVMLENRYGVLFEKYKYKIHEFLKSYNTKENMSDRLLDNFTKECLDVYFNTMFTADYFLINLSEMLNIKLNLLNKYRKEHCLIHMLNEVKEKMNSLKEDLSSGVKIENDSEFYFLLGQVVYYIESLSKGDLDFGIFKFYTEKRISKHVKNYLIQRLEVYGFKINLHNKLFKSVMEAILIYEAKDDIRKHSESFYLGVCCDNIFYGKSC